MALRAKKIEPPSTDKRWRLVDTTMRRNGYKRDALIETLHAVQEAFGYVDDDSLAYVARCLRVPLSAAYGVVTFYHFFTLKPQGKHTCVVCTGTACYIKQAQQLLESLEARLGIGDGETTPDGEVSLLTARCIGSCGLAPVVVTDKDVVRYATADSVIEQIERWRHGQS